jgi:hypothetical protein
VVQGKAKVGAVIGGFVHGAVKLRATRHDSGELRFSACTEKCLRFELCCLTLPS